MCVWCCVCMCCMVCVSVGAVCVCEILCKILYNFCVCVRWFWGVLCVWRLMYVYGKVVWYVCGGVCMGYSLGHVVSGGVTCGCGYCVYVGCWVFCVCVGGHCMGGVVFVGGGGVCV